MMESLALPGVSIKAWCFCRRVPKPSCGFERGPGHPSNQGVPMGRGRCGRGVVGVVLVLVLAGAGAAELQAQGFQWPERSENLQVLPADFPADRLRAVMQGFTRSLGVRCSHCHVGEEGQPLGSYDFVSDDNRNKRVARIMLEMLGSINEYLDQVEPSGAEPVNMWCHTCHNGKPRPLTLAEALGEALAAGGVEGALAEFQALRGRYFATPAFDFSARGVAGVVQEWIGAGETQAALALARRNLEDYPQVAVTHQSLAGVLLEMGDRDQAIVHLEHALELEPDNRQVQRELERLRGGG
jgi:tetratricopeptide (TPR) repeat protein